MQSTAFAWSTVSKWNAASKWNAVSTWRATSLCNADVWPTPDDLQVSVVLLILACVPLRFAYCFGLRTASVCVLLRLACCLRLAC